MQHEPRAARARHVAAQAWRLTLRGLTAALAVCTSPATVVVALLSIGFTCAVLGAFLLAGQAWALVVAAVLCFAIAGLLLRGLARG